MPENSPVEESATVSTEVTQSPEEAAPSAQGAESADPAQTPDTSSTAPEAKPETPAWVQRRIDQLTREKHEERRQREALEARIAQGTEAPTGEQFTQDQIDARAAKIAQTQIKQAKFDDACNAAYSKGKEEFKDFDETLRTFGMLGGLSPEFLEIATDIPDGHKVLYALGKNPEEASRVLSLPPLKMAMELSRMADKLGKSPAASVSNAPAPISPIDGTARVEKDPAKMSVDEWMRWRNETRRKPT